MSNVKFYNVDCMEHMASVPDKYYDLAIVDPPYGIGIGGVTSFNKNAKHQLTTYKSKEWDNNIPTFEYFKEVERICKNYIVWGGNYFTEFLPPSKNWIVWDKVQPEKMHFSQAELAWVKIGKGVKMFKKSIASTNNRVSNNSILARQYLRIHPTQKPVALYKWLLTHYAKEGDKIFDSHGGSMSSAIACNDLHFDLDICELDKDYFDAGVKRFNNHIAQTTLF